MADLNAFSMDELHQVIAQARDSLNAADRHFDTCGQRLSTLTAATRRAQRSLGISVSTIGSSDRDWNYLRNINKSVSGCIQDIRQDFRSSGLAYEYDVIRQNIDNGQSAIEETQASVEQISVMVAAAREQFNAERAVFQESEEYRALQQVDSPEIQPPGYDPEDWAKVRERERAYGDVEKEYADIEDSLNRLKQDLQTVSTDSVALDQSVRNLDRDSVERLCDGVERNLRAFERDSQKIQDQLDQAYEREELARVRAGQVEHRDLGMSAIQAIEAKKEIQQHQQTLAEYRERLAGALTEAGENFSTSPVKEELDRIAGSMNSLKDINETLTQTEQNLDGAYVQLDSIRAGVETAKDNLETVEISLDTIENQQRDMEAERAIEREERELVNRIEPDDTRADIEPEPEAIPEPLLTNHEKGVTARQTAFDKVMESPEWADAKNGCVNNPDSAQLVVDQIWRREQSEKIAQQLAGKEPVFVTVPSSTGKNTIPEALAERIIADTGRGTHIRGEDLSEGHNALAMKHIPREQRAFVPREYEVYDNAKDIIGDRTVVLVEDVFSSGASAKAFADSLKEKGIEIETSAGLVGDSRLYPEPQLVQKLQKTIKRDKVLLNAKDVAKVLSRGQIKTAIERLNQEKTHDGKQDIARGIQGVLDSRASRHLREHSQPEVGGPEYSSRESDRHAPVSPGIQDQSRVAPEDHEHSGQMHGQAGSSAERAREGLTEQQPEPASPPERDSGRDAGSPVSDQRTLTEPETSSPQRSVDAPSPDSPSPELSPEEQAARLKLLHQVQDAFVVKTGVTGTKFHFKDDPSKTAFKDKGNSMLAASNDDRAVKAMVMMAQAKGWDSIKVSGQPEFRAKMWMEASKAGLEVKGYKPTEIELRQLEEFRDQQNRNRVEPADPRLASREQNPPAPAPTAPEKAPASMRDALVGKVAQSFIDSKITDPAQRDMAQRLIAEKLAQMAAQGKTVAVPVYDKTAPSQNQSERSKVVEQPRSERTR